jgi:hypothetical protein
MGLYDGSLHISVPMCEKSDRQGLNEKIVVPNVHNVLSRTIAVRHSKLSDRLAIGYMSM